MFCSASIFWLTKRAGAKTRWRLSGSDAANALARASVNQKRFRLDEQARIEREARAQLLAEQEEKLEEMRGSDGMSEQMEARIRRIRLGKE